MQRTRTGIGPALRKARLHRGKSLQEASRETRIRADQLDALEREAFDALAGDVYVRGFLRTYSQYLGLRPDKVLSAYEERYGAPEAAPVEPRRSSVRLEGALAARPHRPHRARLVAVAGAGVVLLVAGALGILSGDRPSPTAATPPARPPSGAVAVTQGVTVAMLALEEVRVTVLEDGRASFDGLLREGESVSFAAVREISVEAERGGVLQLSVNGAEVGVPGDPSAAYEVTFRPPQEAATSFPSPGEGDPTEEPDPSTAGG